MDARARGHGAAATAHVLRSYATRAATITAVVGTAARRIELDDGRVVVGVACAAGDAATVAADAAAAIADGRVNGGGAT